MRDKSRWLLTAAIAWLGVALGLLFTEGSRTEIFLTLLISTLWTIEWWRLQ